jgi:hypothetical protein
LGLIGHFGLVHHIRNTRYKSNLSSNRTTDFAVW